MVSPSHATSPRIFATTVIALLLPCILGASAQHPTSVVPVGVVPPPTQNPPPVSAHPPATIVPVTVVPQPPTSNQPVFSPTPCRGRVPDKSGQWICNNGNWFHPGYWSLDEDITFYTDSSPIVVGGNLIFGAGRLTLQGPSMGVTVQGCVSGPIKVYLDYSAGWPSSGFWTQHALTQWSNCTSISSAPFQVIRPSGCKRGEPASIGSPDHSLDVQFIMTNHYCNVRLGLGLGLGALAIIIIIVVGFLLYRRFNARSGHGAERPLMGGF